MRRVGVFVAGTHWLNSEFGWVVPADVFAWDVATSLPHRPASAQQAERLIGDHVVFLARPHGACRTRRVPMPPGTAEIVLRYFARRDKASARR